MLKTDLHIHTSPSIYEEQFIFSLDSLKKYIEINNLGIIAITNHNHFNKEQFNFISANLECKIFPGVEVDIESSHILIIVPDDRIVELDISCSNLASKITSNNDSISYEDFVNIFPNYRDYILIPHYKKDPAIKKTTLEKFGDLIKTGEVKSAKKFEVTKKEASSLVPVYFSDIRAREDLEDFPAKHVFLDIDDASFGVIKNAISDRTKVFLSESKKSDEFAFLGNGTTASTKMNIIIGKRSSGKTYNLNQINKLKDRDNIKLIKQFSLTGKSEEETFNKLVLQEQEKFIIEFLEPLQKITSKILQLDENDTNLEEYLISLKEYASNQSLQDAYSKSKLFNEIEYTTNDNFDTVNIIKAFEKIIDSNHNSDIITKYISKEKLLMLLNELIERRKKEFLNCKIKLETNKIIKIIKEKLTSKSALPSVKGINLYEIQKNSIMVKKFNHLCENLKVKSIIYQSGVQRFNFSIIKDKIESTNELKRILKTSISLSNSFSMYSDSFNYIKSLIQSGIAQDDVYKGILKFKVEVTNENGNLISGGERAEYNLLREIKDAENYDILLLDEPEASFDNPFIKEYIIDLLKDISQKTTVFITTHNNSLGMLINPNKIIYTSNENGKFNVYTSEFGSKELKTIDGDKILSYDKVLEVMEAGKDAYEERKLIYETFKN